MKTLITLMMMWTTVASAQLVARGTEGHGADAIVCREPETKETIERKERKIVKQVIEGIEYPTLLDYHEGFNIGKTIGLGPKTDSVRAKVEKMMLRLDPYFPIWTKELRAEAEKILFALERHTPGKVEIINGVQFTNQIMKDLDDDRSVHYPEGCAKEQFVIRSTGEIPDQPDYMIKRDILEASDNDILAGMVFHEVVFKFSVENEKILVSPGSRYIVRNVAAPEADSFDYVSYSTLLTKAKFGKVYFDVAGAKVFPAVEKRSDGKWQGRLAEKFKLSDGAEEAFYHYLVWKDGAIDNEATRLSNPRRVAFISWYNDRIPNIEIRVGDQRCTALKDRRNNTYRTTGCSIYLPRGPYDFEITAATKGKVHMGYFSLDGNEGYEQKVEKNRTVVKGKVVIR